MVVLRTYNYSNNQVIFWIVIKNLGFFMRIKIMMKLATYQIHIHFPIKLEIKTFSATLK